MLDSLRTRLLLTLALTVAVAVGTVALLASRVSASELQRFMQRDMERNTLLLNTLVTSYDEGAGLKDAQATVDRLARELGERIVVVGAGGAVLADSSGQLLGRTLGCADRVPAIVVTVGEPRCAGLPDGETHAFALPAPGEAQAGVIFFGVGVSDTLQLRAPDPPATLGTFELAPVPEVVEDRQLALASSAPGKGTLLMRAAKVSLSRPQSLPTDPIVAGFISTVNQSVLLAALASGALALVLTAVLSRSVLGPVEALTQAARRMGAGDLRQRVAVRARGEIGDLARAFNAMADGLARQEELRRHMVTDVAHELRTPLTNIRGYLEALRDGVARPDAATIESLHEEALLLNRLIDDLQELALAEAGQLRLDRRLLRLGPLLERAAAAARPRADEKSVRLEVCLPPDLPPVEADPERVGQVLRNLLSNAITHTPHGGAITLSAECRVLSAETAYQQRGDALSSQHAVLISVTDTGPGIAPEYLELVFERFFRADASRSRATGGAGLGLTIVRRLVEAHGGCAWAESRPGYGATFCFTLPAAHGSAKG
ncbi:MAG TPA: ATP-binding protein [Roseiflexaceae bacterium]|nr:ATP-binding protein [Roseiflexaceae bacterium]